MRNSLKSRPALLALALAVGVSLAACGGSGGGGSGGGGSANASSSGTGSSSGAAGGGVSFAGKTITLVSPFSAGGSADVLARLTGAKLANFLPGKPTVVVKDVVGGGGSVGLNYVAQLHPANGLTIGFFGAGMAVRYISKTTGFSSLPGQPLIGGFPQGLVSPINASLGDNISKLQSGKKLRIAQTAAGGTGSLDASIGYGLLKIPYKDVYGFTGGSEEATSMLRGEVDANMTADTSYDKTFQPYVKSGKMTALFQTGVMNASGQIVRSPLVPNVPTILERYQKLNNGAKPTGDLWNAYQIAANLDTANYVVAVRKGTPSDVLATLRKAFNKMVTSQDWKKFTSSKLTVPLAGENSTIATKSWGGFLKSSPAQVALFEKYSGLKKK